jgi:hypothetical protein
MLIALALACVAISAPSRAQETGPQAGTWGAETTPSGAVSVLRFRSPASAWLMGFSVNYLNRDEEDATRDQRSTSAELRLGIRSYRNPQERVRPFTSIAGTIGYLDNVFDKGTLTLGGAADFGVAYFFSRHVSLGTALDLSASYSKSERSDFVTGESLDVTTIIARVGLRFLGAVYF